MSYDDKMTAARPPDSEPWDTNRYGAPDPAWSLDKQLAWFSRYSHILLLNCSEGTRRRAAAAADEAVAL